MSSKAIQVKEILIGQLNLGKEALVSDPLPRQYNNLESLKITNIRPGKYEVYLIKNVDEDRLRGITLRHKDTAEIKENGYYSKDFFPLNKVTTESGLITIFNNKFLNYLPELYTVAKELVNDSNKAGVMLSDLIAAEAGKGSHTIICQSDRYTKVFTIAIAFTI